MEPLKMVLEVSDNLKQVWEGLRQLLGALALFRRFSLAFKGL